MATPILYDRVLDTSTTTGTGQFTLSGTPVSGYQAWSVVGDGLTSYYYIEGVDADGIPNGEWEVGLGTYVSSGTKLTRTTVLKSSNSNAAVNFSSGTKRVGNIIPAGILNLLYNPPACKATFLTGTQAIGNGSVTTVTLTTADAYDTDAMHDPSGGNPSRVTINTAGVYRVLGEALFERNAIGDRLIYIALNGTEVSGSLYPASNNFFYWMQQEFEFLAAVNDYVEIKVYQNSSISLNIIFATLAVTRAAVG